MYRPTRRDVLAGGTAGIAGLAGCFAGSPDERPRGDGEAGWPDDPTWESATGSPLDADVRAVTAVRDLSIPWDLTFAGGDAFVTERNGGVRRIDAEALATAEDLASTDLTTVLTAEELPDRTGTGEGGTLGVTAHPEYPETSAVFLYYTAEDEQRNRVVRYDIDMEELSVVVDDIPASRWHNGGRITVGPEGHLWVLNGDAQEPDLSQDATSLGGSVLRVTLDGEPVDGNPDFGAGTDARIYTLGHRNPQGIGFTPDGEPLVAEHGPSARDEVNALRPGGNYGWDVARGGSGGVQYGSYGDNLEFTPPVVNTGSDSTWAPSGAVFYTDDTIPAWKNRLFVAGLRSQTLFAVTLERGDHATESGERFDAEWLDERYDAAVHRLYDGEYGRLRHVEQGPDGALYLLTSNHDGRVIRGFPTDDDDRIIRIEPR